MTRVVIKCAANGPNLIELDGTVFAAMCRCGATNTKPYCDGTHAKIGFKAEAERDRSFRIITSIYQCYHMYGSMLILLRPLLIRLAFFKTYS